MTAAVPPPIARAPRESPMGVVEGWPGYWCGNCTLLAYQGKDIVVFRFIIIEYSSLRDFYRPLCNNNNRSIYFCMRIFET
jgi:hypothetical protein